MTDIKIIATGRRKEATARIHLLSGNGQILINERPLENFFPRYDHRTTIWQPFDITNSKGKYDVRAKVRGGGMSGQAEAIRQGIARALASADENYRMILRKKGLLTRDSRVKERKKYGQKGARKRFQWTKR